TFVALDEAGKPKPVPPLVPESPGEKLRFQEAVARRAQRLALADERRRLAETHAEPNHGAPNHGEQAEQGEP
ncbi:MAG: hypothetical protein KC731_13775, partial [Myxococcales bacterium]|nr:hypothetical protein [Myxococcales bacterium]